MDLPSPGVLYRWRRWLNIDSDPEQPYVSGSTILDAYWRTLFHDRSPHNARLRADDKTRVYDDMWWWEYVRARYQTLDGGNIPQPQGSRNIGSHVKILCTGRVLVRTRQGYLGLTPDDAREGDQVWVLSGGKLPLVLRPRETGGHGYTVVGDSYIHGIMDGEVFRQWRERGDVLQTVTLS